MSADAGGGTEPSVAPVSFMLPVSGGHELYVETSGSPSGLPAVYLHGGPGSGCQPAHRRLFDAARFRPVLFDQRGAGRSRPSRERRNNTTPDLIADMEAIRERLNIERWLLVGGSWGATLALAYAEQHPERVTGLVLRAAFLGTRTELEQAFGATLRQFYPGLHADFLGWLPRGERAAPLAAYWRRILDPDPVVHGPAVGAWYDTERILSEFRPATTRLNITALANAAPGLPATPFMEAHYFSNDCFMAPGQLLANAGALAGIRGVIVQGRYDLLCPPATAFALATAWPDAEVRVVDAAGHSLDQPGVTEAVTAAIASFG